MTARKPPSVLVVASELAGALAQATPPVVLDVRWELGGPPGIEGYGEGHIPGAVFVDLESELAGPPGPGGRHPLPAAVDFASAMAGHGVSAARPVVVYDGATSVAAARAWWLLRYFGHQDVRVLNGGLAAWQAAGLPLSRTTPRPQPGDFRATAGAMPVLDATAAAALAAGGGVLLDARAPERFRGEREPVDPVAGHVPGAVNLPTAENLRDDRWKSPGELAEVYAVTDRGGPVAVYCGSGVTATHDLFALHLLGRGGALYAGSWSHWVTDPDRPVATGP